MRSKPEATFDFDFGELEKPNDVAEKLPVEAPVVHEAPPSINHVPTYLTETKPTLPKRHFCTKYY